jgi:membrane peptidoglycan carboxypeptidase
VSAVQNASGFSTFANGGVHMEAHVVKSVTDADGAKDVVKPASTEVIGKQAAADTVYAMEQVVQRGTGTAARLYDRPVAGKTGTTDDSGAVWFNGFTPQLAVAVNMFRDDNKTVTIPGYGVQFGGQLPAQIWRAFMTEAMQGKPVEEFPEPSERGYGGYDDAAPERFDEDVPDWRPSRRPDDWRTDGPEEPEPSFSEPAPTATPDDRGGVPDETVAPPTPDDPAVPSDGTERTGTPEQRDAPPSPAG